MKQRRQLQQRTELQRKTPLRRTSQLKPATTWSVAGDRQANLERGPSLPVKLRKALKPGPGRKPAEEKRGRGLVHVRCGGLCEVWVPGVCVGIAAVFSHRKRRSQSSKAEKWSATNGLGGCQPCEQYLTDHGSDALVRANGWTVHPSLDPSAVPVLRRGVYVWLREDGSLTECDLAEVAVWVLRREVA